MATYKHDVKLMAKNSAFLYVQMAVKMAIGLFTVRIILNALGAEDYGVYNVVGGFVTMFTFITNSLVSASQRFFAYAMGRGEYNMLNRYFNATVLIFIILAAILFIVIEGAGLWFVNCKMVVSPERLTAANWVLQLSILSFIVRIMSVPTSAMLVSYEKMIAYAFIHILDSLLILGVAFLLRIVDGDKLIIYAVCMFGISLIMSALFIILGHKNFPEATKLHLKWDGALSRELFGYCGWYMFGTMADVMRSQGINMLLNVFFNPVVNAARAIAFQINSAINQFVNSFYQAVRPQITKLTAAEENQKMISLVFSSSIISFLLMCLVAVPLLVEMPFVLSIWLNDVPEHTVIFSRLVILTAMIDTLGVPPTTAICATGKIKFFEIGTGFVILLNLPISYLALTRFQQPYIVFYVSIALAVVTQMVRIVFLHKIFNMTYKSYYMEVFLRVFVIACAAILFTLFIKHIMVSSTLGHLVTILLSFLFIAVISYWCGINKRQRIFFNNLIIGKLSKKISNR